MTTGNFQDGCAGRRISTHRWGADARGSIGDRVRSFAADLARWWQARNCGHSLAELSDHQLLDIGLVRRDAVPHATFRAWLARPDTGPLLAQRIASAGGTAASRGRDRLIAAFGAIRASAAGFRTADPALRGAAVLLPAWRIARTLVEWRARAMDRRALAMLDDHLLRDIGLSRADVEREVSKPFWRR